MIAIIIIGVLIDQISKYLVLYNEADFTVIPELLNITLTKNFGGVFGIMQGANAMLAVVTAIICIGILVIIWYIQNNKKSVPVGVYFILAGGIGNLVDRIFRGFVVDFIDTPFIATFNIADSMIVCGTILAIVQYAIAQKNNVNS